MSVCQEYETAGEVRCVGGGLRQEVEGSFRHMGGSGSHSLIRREH